MGSIPRNWLFELSRLTILDWYLKKSGNVFKLQDAKPSLIILVKEDGSIFVIVTFNDKLLYERSTSTTFKSINCPNIPT